MDAVKMGNLIRQKRTEKHMTQKELAEKIHVSVPAISKYENGKGFPDISLLEPLAKELDLSINELLSGTVEQREDSEPVKEVIEIARDQEKRKLARRTLIMVLIIAMLALSSSLAIRKMKMIQVIRNYQYILPEDYDQLKETDLITWDSFRRIAWLEDCMMIHARIPHGATLNCITLNNGTSDEIKICFVVSSLWTTLIMPKMENYYPVTYGKEMSSRIRFLYFYNGAMDYNELLEYMRKDTFSKEDQEMLLNDSVLLYDRGY